MGAAGGGAGAEIGKGAGAGACAGAGGITGIFECDDECIGDDN